MHDTGEQQPGVRTWRLAVAAMGWLLLAVPLAQLALTSAAVRLGNPARAMLFDESDADALTLLAAQRLQTGDAGSAEALASQAVARSLMSVPALRTSALAAERQGNAPRAAYVMSLAARFGWRDPGVQIWMLKAFVTIGDSMSAMERADALARTNQYPQFTLPVFFAALTTADLRRALAERMAPHPFWRRVFFSRLGEVPANRLGALVALLSDLAAAGGPASQDEVLAVVERLVKGGDYRGARALWASRGAIEGLNLRSVPLDGSFEHTKPSGTPTAPFEWRLPETGNGQANILEKPDDARRHELVVMLDPGFSGQLINQTLLLDPGHYRLRMRAAGDTSLVGDGVDWSLTCLPAGQANLLRKEISVEEGRLLWSVDVPVGCRAQQLALDVRAGVITSSGVIRFDDLAIAKP